MEQPNKRVRAIVLEYGNSIKAIVNLLALPLLHGEQSYMEKEPAEIVTFQDLAPLCARNQRC